MRIARQSLRTSKKVRLLFLSVALVYAVLMAPTAPTAFAQEGCIEAWGEDDTLYETDCCSGMSVPGSMECDCWECAYYGDYSSCTQICAPSSN